MTNQYLCVFKIIDASVIYNYCQSVSFDPFNQSRSGPMYLWSTRGIQFSLAKNCLCPAPHSACTDRSFFPRPYRFAISGRFPNCRSPFGKLKSVNEDRKSDQNGLA